ncbi:MAG TPA: 6-bladed beta-propeller [Rhodocyclaceae bacterium]|nr:6-bladed beta-propeller [Rhodocyclaceae bacterium]
MSFKNLKMSGWCLVLGVLAGCVTVAEKRDIEKVGRAATELVFPAPPDEPRFIFERAIRSSSDVVPESDESALRRALTGEGERGGESLGKPYAVAVLRGKIYVSDSVDRAVRVFDVPAQKYYKIGDEGQSGLTKPMGLDLDDAGNLFVADATQKAVLAFDKDGKFVRKIGSPKLFDRLSSVTVDEKGERLYVVDIGGVGSEKHRVLVFDAKSGDHLFDIGKRGSGPGELNLPRDVALGKNGQIYVVDGGNFRVQVFDREGKYLRAFGAVGKQLGNFARPKEIAIDKQGNVYVADAAFGNFQIFTAEGDLLMYVGERGEQDLPAKYMLPSGIAVDEDGRIYFVDQWFRRVDVYRPYALKSEDGFLGMRIKKAEPKAAEVKSTEVKR